MASLHIRFKFYLFVHIPDSIVHLFVFLAFRWWQVKVDGFEFIRTTQILFQDKNNATSAKQLAVILSRRSAPNKHKIMLTYPIILMVVYD